MDFRTGLGIDVHAFADGRKLVLGGVHVPHARGLAGHSDADALTHAIIDAVLGAAGKQDIGHLFPDTDPRWKDADSIDLLKRAWALVKREGWQVVNLDCVMLVEEPRLAPYTEAMRKRIAEALEMQPDLIGIKVTTSEGLGYIGRREGVQANTVVLLKRN